MACYGEKEVEPVPTSQPRAVSARGLRDEPGDAPAVAPTLTPSPTPLETLSPTENPYIPIPVVAYPEGSVEALICTYPWPCGQAVAVASCESGLGMDGYLDGWWASSAGNYGLFQINSVHAGKFTEFWDRWMDPAYNIEMAFTIWSEQGWRPWGCSYMAYQ